MSFADFGPVLRRLGNRVANLLFRGPVMRVANGQSAQLVAVSGRHNRDTAPIEHLLPFGLDFYPLPPGADGKGPETVVLQMSPGHAVALPAMDRRHRSKSGVTSPGDVAVFNAAGARVLMKANGDMEITAPGKVTATAGDLFRIDAREVQIHADDKLSLDVNGFGENWIHAGGEYRIDEYKTGNVVPGSSNAISPPDHEAGE